MALTTTNNGTYEDKGWANWLKANTSGYLNEWADAIASLNKRDIDWGLGGANGTSWFMTHDKMDEVARQWDAYHNSIANAKAEGKQVVDSATLQKVQQKLRDKDLAAVTDVGNTQNVASSATQANINAGINKSLSGMLGSQTASETSIQSPMYQALANQNASTQADYLARLGEIQGLENQAANLRNAENNVGISSAIQGGITGASAGFMVSDEETKEYNNKQGLPKAGVRDALRQIESIQYKYKPETGLDQDKHVGITAQSLLGTPWEGIVNEEGEYLSLDKQKLLEAVMAGIADLQKQIDVLSRMRK